MTGKPERLGNVTDEAARALDLIAAIEASPGTDVKLLCALLRQVVLDLDEVLLTRELIRVGDMLAAAFGRLPDRPAETEAPRRADAVPWNDLKPYEKQQGGYWLYGTDPFGADKQWIPVRPAETEAKP